MKMYLLAILMVLAANCSFAAATPGVTDDEIILGAHTIESGKLAVLSASNLAISAYFEKINSLGGVLGRKIKYIRIDTQLDADKTLSATKKLVEVDHIFAMLMGFGTAHQAVFKYLVEQRVPDIMIGDIASMYGEPLEKSAFPNSFPISSEAETMVKYFAPRNKGKKICILTVDEKVMGEEFLKGAQKEISNINRSYKEQDKLKIAADEIVKPSSLNADPQVLQFKKAACDIVMTSTIGPLTMNAISFSAKQNFKPQWFVNGINTSFPKFLVGIPENVRSGIVASTVVALNETFAVADWKSYADLMKKNSIPISRASAFGYANAEFMVDILNRSGKGLTREKLITAAEGMTGTTCSICVVSRSTSPKNHWTYLSPKLVISKENNWVSLD